MKSIDIVSKIVAREGEAKASPSKGIQSINLSDYLLKSVWDKVFEVRTDSQGAEYIFGKLPMVTQYGITMYSGDDVNVPSLASGLPFDGRTIWYNPDTQQIEVIGGTGGGSGEGVSNFWDLSGIPSWITNSKPKYTYSEIEGTPDLTKYALASQIPSLSGYATESWVTKQNYATKATTLSGYGITDAYTKTNVDDLLKSYVTLGGTQTITGEKNFTGGLKVNGSHIYYDTDKKYWKLEGDLLVTGGVTMYGSDSSFTPSTIMDALLYDDTTLGINSNGELYVKGGTSGGGLNITALQNYLTQNSYLNVTGGDNRYLQLSGGTISSPTFSPLYIVRESTSAATIGFSNSVGKLGNLGFNDTTGPKWFDNSYTEFPLLHSGNYSSYALPLSGGTITGTLVVNENLGVGGSIVNKAHYLFARDNNNADWIVTNKGWNAEYTLWHSGNDGSGSGLDADLLDGQEETTFAKWKAGIASSGEHRHIGYAYGSGGWKTSGAAMSFGADKNFFMQIQGGGSKNKDVLLYARYIYEGVYSDWKTIAFTDSNVASATKLQTARTIWGQSFDGTGNVDGLLSINGIGVLYSNGTTTCYIGSDSIPNTYISGGNINLRYGTNIGLILNSSGNVGIGTASPSAKLHVVGNFKTNDVWIGSDTGTYIEGTQTGGLRIQYANSENKYTQIQLKDLTVTINNNLLCSGGITMYSDQRKKTILNHVELSLKDIANAPLIEHYYNGDEKKTTHVGSIAQYWASINDWFCKLDSEGFYTMEIQNAALASAISIARELDRYETKTDKAIKKLKMRICELEEEVERLKSA